MLDHGTLHFFRRQWCVWIRNGAKFAAGVVHTRLDCAAELKLADDFRRPSPVSIPICCQAVRPACELGPPKVLETVVFEKWIWFILQIVTVHPFRAGKASDLLRQLGRIKIYCLFFNQWSVRRRWIYWATDLIIPVHDGLHKISSFCRKRRLSLPTKVLRP